MILILGGDGMLGHKIFQCLKSKFQVKVTLRCPKENYSEFSYLYDDSNTYFGVDINILSMVEDVLKDFSPSYVINCIGIVNQRNTSKDLTSNIEINALLPHKLAFLCYKYNSKLIHFSTDCVFSGNGGDYKVNDLPDPVDLYGRTKLLGEIADKEYCLTIRTSLIGLELKHKKSLIEWFLSQTGTVCGYKNAIYTGVTTKEMARILEFILTGGKLLSGVCQITSEPINKYKLLLTLKEKLQKEDINIVEDYSVTCNRSLDGSEFEKKTGFIVSSWDQMLSELADEICLRNTA